LETRISTVENSRLFPGPAIGSGPAKKLAMLMVAREWCDVWRILQGRQPLTA
jgi:hypothetical protein